MRVLWFSNAPWGNGGYGVQTRHAMKHLTKYHELAIACNYGLQGGMLHSDGVRVYPQGRDMHSNDIAQFHADDFKADVIVSLYDVWTLKFANLHTPWLPWTMVDHAPVPKIVTDALKPAYRPVACSQFGQAELQRAGFDAAYIPLGYDGAIYKPGNKAEARKRLGMPQDKFIAVMVAANKSYPPRKCFPQVLQAWAKFAGGRDDVMLYLHTEVLGVHGGVKIGDIVDSLGVHDTVHFCEQYQLVIGFPDAYMADVINAADVLVNPSVSEGFGVPIIEAQACGTPVITADNSSMPELTGGGIVVGCDPWWSAQGSWIWQPRVGEIADALDVVYRERQRSDGDGKFCRWAGSAIEKAKGYEWTQIACQWDELLRATGAALERVQ